MLKYNLKLAFRNLFRNKGFSLINISGLAIGLMSFLFIVYWIRDELSYDKFHTKSDRIYRIYWYSELAQTRTPHPMTYAMVSDFPEVENAVSLTPVFGPGLTQPDRIIRYGEKWFEESGIYAADTTFFQVFDFQFLKGNPATALKDVGSVILSETAARKLFGDEDPVNKIITINFGVDAPLKVSGVIRDVPRQSHFHFNFLLSYVTLKAYEQGEWFTWADFGHYNYLLLKPGFSPRTIEKKMMEWSRKYIDFPETAWKEYQSGIIGLKLQPLEDIHLRSGLKWELEPNGNIMYVYIFLALGVLILIIACINFTNLTVARTTGRLKEIGIKKLSGATHFQIQGQFISEALISSTIALGFAIILFELSAPGLGNLADKPFRIDYSDPMTYLVFIGLSVACGLLSGIYPAWILSGLSPAGILKGQTSERFRNSGIRNGLLVFQFAVSIFLIISAWAITLQTRFLRDKKLGFNSTQLLIVPIKDTLVQQNYESVKAQILLMPGISNISAVSNLPGKSFNQNPIQWKSGEDTYSASELRVDHDFFETMQLKIVKGRGFSQDRPSDIEFAFILNETAASLFRWDDPLQQDLIWHDDEVTREGKVIGVVEDFHFQSLHHGIEPLIIHIYQQDFNYFLIRLQPGNIPGTLSLLKDKFGKLDPSHPFTYSFLDTDLAALYSAEERMEKVIKYFTALALVISLFGLFSLSTFAIEKRTKEIGIRKVNGASVTDIINLLSIHYTRWILLGWVLSCPVAWILLKYWLDGFSMKIPMPWILFVAAGVISLGIGLITIFHLTWNAAHKNPVDVLRYE